MLGGDSGPAQQQVDDRLSVASAWLENAARKDACGGWAEVRFADVAQRTSMRFDFATDSTRAGDPRPFMLPDDSSVYAPMREFLSRYPNTEVDVYLVPRPPVPPVELTMVTPGYQGLPHSFAEAWRQAENSLPGQAFDPAPLRRLDLPALVSTSTALGCGGTRRPNAAESTLGWSTRRWRVPATCNARVSTVMANRGSRADPDVRGLSFRADEPLEEAVPVGLYVAGPLRLIGLPQFTTRSRAEAKRSATDRVRRASA
jgi:hypothetical protein